MRRSFHEITRTNLPLSKQAGKDGAEATAEQKAIAQQEAGAGQSGNEPLPEVPWDGTLEGETIELKEDEEE